MYIRHAYLEVQDDRPYQAQHNWWSPIHQICRIDIDQLDSFAGQKLQGRIGIAKEMWTP